MWINYLLILPLYLFALAGLKDVFHEEGFWLVWVGAWTAFSCFMAAVCTFNIYCHLKSAPREEAEAMRLYVREHINDPEPTQMSVSVPSEPVSERGSSSMSRQCPTCCTTFGRPGELLCSRCKGHGYVEVRTGDDRLVAQSCTLCQGQGWVECRRCNGTGRIED